MLDLLAATAVLLVMVAVLALAGLGLTVVPYVVALDMAQARRFSTARAGALALTGVLVGLAGAFLLYRSDLPTVLLLLPLGLCWLVPGALWLLDEGQVAVGGRQGAHE